KQALLEKITARTACIGVIGLGYVGLPLVVEFARAGFHCTGFEVNDAKAEAINRGQSYIPDVPGYLVAGLVASDRLQATTHFSAQRALQHAQHSESSWGGDRSERRCCGGGLRRDRRESASRQFGAGGGNMQAAGKHLPLGQYWAGQRAFAALLHARH